MDGYIEKINAALWKWLKHLQFPFWDESINKERLEPTEKQIRHKCNKNVT